MVEFLHIAAAVYLAAGIGALLGFVLPMGDRKIPGIAAGSIGAAAYGSFTAGKEFIGKTAPVSVALIRQMMWRMMGADDPMEAHKVDSRGIYARGRSDDVKEGVVSFLEKRPAEFKNKVSSDMPDYFPWWDERDYK